MKITPELLREVCDALPPGFEIKIVEAEDEDHTIDFVCVSAAHGRIHLRMRGDRLWSIGQRYARRTAHGGPFPTAREAMAALLHFLVSRTDREASEVAAKADWARAHLTALEQA